MGGAVAICAKAGAASAARITLAPKENTQGLSLCLIDFRVPLFIFLIS
jgi:hypothetical protein